jgi:hypothetical protein
MKYHGRWATYDEMVADWFPDYSYETKKKPADFPTDEQIVGAFYGGGSYDGQALVIFTRDGEWFEVNAGHCSCYGLEDQWEPEKTSIDALKSRHLEKYDFDDAVIEAFGAMKATW